MMLLKCAVVLVLDAQMHGSISLQVMEKHWTGKENYDGSISLQVKEKRWTGKENYDRSN